MLLNNNTNGNYTMRQLKLSLEFEKLIDISDPVYTFCEVMDHIDLSRCFVEKGYKTGHPRCDAQKLLNVILFAFMENGICSLREIEKLCHNDIRYMYLLDGMKTPSFAMVIVPHTKTYVDRYFPISDDLADFLVRLKAVHDKYYCGSKYLFPANSANGVITNNTIYDFYRRACKKLGIEVNQEFRKGTHSFRRNAITDVVNASGDNIILASKLFGNSPEVAKKNYFTGIDMQDALECLNKRKFS